MSCSLNTNMNMAKGKLFKINNMQQLLRLTPLIFRSHSCHRQTIFIIIIIIIHWSIPSIRSSILNSGTLFLPYGWNHRIRFSCCRFFLFLLFIFPAYYFCFVVVVAVMAGNDAIVVVVVGCCSLRMEVCLFSIVLIRTLSFDGQTHTHTHTLLLKNYKPVSTMTAAFYEHFENWFCQHICHLNAIFFDVTRTTTTTYQTQNHKVCSNKYGLMLMQIHNF